MTDWALRKFGSHYVAVMMLITRVIGCAGGLLTIYYVNLTTHLPPHIRHHWDLSALAVVILALILTFLLALWETPTLRRVLGSISAGKPIDPDQGQRAACEAITFPGRHHLHEALVVPACTIGVVCPLLWWLDRPSATILVQIAIAGFLGISVSLLFTFFASEHWVVPLVRHLLAHGVRIDFDALPASRLGVRINICFSLTIVITALMIGSLANQRALDIIRNPDQQAEAVANLRHHTLYILVTAVLVGLILARLLSNSVTARVGQLVEAMKRVQSGALSERLQPTGTDEIDHLTRQFNAMVGQLDENDQVIRDLNVNLEKKVRRRTRQLSRSRRSLKRSLKKLQEHDRLKSEFFSNVSHELRTPLTMILSPVERLLQTHGHELPTDAASLLEVTRLNGNRLLKLINQLLDFSKLEAEHTRLTYSAVDVNRLIHELADAASPLAESRGIRLCLDCDPQVPVFGADQEKLNTILSNLLSNALKFTSSGGSVHVETALVREPSAHEAARDRPGPAVEREPTHVRVTVTDTGIGIAESDYEKIFQRFVQIDGSMSREYSGTGLGLPLCKELVELHGGEIHVDSEPGWGSAFWFRLPLTAPPQLTTERSNNAPPAPAMPFADLQQCNVSLETPQRKRPASPREAPKVLVVDDTPEMLSLLGDLLAEHYRIDYAADGAEALDAVAREIPDLIISDAMMPHVDGYEFCRRIKEDPATAPIPFILLTAKAERSMKITGLNCGADDYLIKPFDTEELHARVRSLLRIRRLHRELDQRNHELEQTLEELRSTQAQLVHAEKMTSIGKLVAGLAHEINNAINAVYNGVQPLQAKNRRLEELVAPMLEESAGAPTDSRSRGEIETAFRKIRSLAEAIEHGSHRAARIVGDLKTFSHPGSEGATWFDLHETLDVCLSLLDNEMRHRVRVQRDYGDVGRIYGPSGQLNQVFMNILTNAQQAIADEGQITIATRRDGDRTVIRIKDDGPGIPENIRNQIFDPFFTTKEPGVGTGLGLSLSYSIVTGLGGTLQCHSEPGAGTEFVITLPCEPPAAEPEPADDESPALCPTVASAEGTFP